MSYKSWRTMSDCLIARVFKQEQTDVLFTAIQKHDRPISRPELAFFLHMIHGTTFNEIWNYIVELGWAHSDQRIDESVIGREPMDWVEYMEDVDSTEDVDHLFMAHDEAANRKKLERTWNRWKSGHQGLDGPFKYIDDDEVNNEYRGFMLGDFPNHFLDRLQKMLFPSWYAACFSGDFSNLARWAHYADNHKGVCLVFERSITKDLYENIRRERATGAPPSFKTDCKYGATAPTGSESNARRSDNPAVVWVHERDVAYRDDMPTLEFFSTLRNSVARYSRDMWQSNVCTDENVDVGNSAYVSDLLDGITTKTPDWADERETRMIIASNDPVIQVKSDRKIKYEFNQLKGIIFGMATTDVNKTRIMEIIQNKMTTVQRDDFSYEQAYFCMKTGEMRTISIKK